MILSTPKLMVITKIFTIFLLIFLIGTLILQWLCSPVGQLDESQILLGGALIKKGLIPGKDFWASSTHLIYYLNALAFSVGGVSVISARILSILFYFIIIFLWIVYVKKITQDKSFKFIFFILLSSLFLIFPLTSQSKWNAYALVFIGILLYLLSFQTAKKWKNYLLFFSGLAIALALLSKINFGLYIILTIVIDFIFQVFRTKAWRRTLKEASIFFLPIALCLMISIAFSKNYLAEVINQVLIFPANSLTENRIISLIPFKEQGLSLLAGILFVLIWTIISLPLIWMSFRNTIKNGRFNNYCLFPLLGALLLIPILFIAEFVSPGLLPKLPFLILILIIVFQIFVAPISREEFIVVICYSLFLHYFLSRSDSWHYATLLPLALVLIFYLFFEPHKSHNKVIKLVNYSLSCFIYLSFFVSLGLYWIIALIIGNSSGIMPSLESTLKILSLRDTFLAQGDSSFLMTTTLPLSLPEASLYPDQDELAALQFVYKNSNQQDFVYIGLKDHSRIFLPNIRSYWILNRPIGVKYHILEPGLTTQEPIQQRMSKELRENNVNWIVLSEDIQPNSIFGKVNPTGAKFLDNYIRTHYKLVKNFNRYSVYKRIVR